MIEWTVSRSYLPRIFPLRLTVFRVSLGYSIALTGMILKIMQFKMLKIIFFNGPAVGMDKYIMEIDVCYDSIMAGL